MKVMETNTKANTKDLRQVTSVINVIMYTVVHKIDMDTVINVIMYMMVKKITMVTVGNVKL